MSDAQRFPWLILAVAVISLGSGSAQDRAYLDLLLPASRHITGIVIDQDGKTVAEARIGSTDDHQVHATDSNGRFEIDTRAPAVVVRKTGFRSARISTQDTSEFTAKLEKVRSTIRTCSDEKRYVGLESFKTNMHLPTLRFPRLRSVHISKQGHDVDYVDRYYYVETAGGKKFGITHGVGPNWTSGPDARDIWQSTAFDEVTFKAGDVMVIDSRGQFPDGTRWRYVGTFSESAAYRRADEATRRVLDEVLDGFCVSSSTR